MSAALFDAKDIIDLINTKLAEYYALHPGGTAAIVTVVPTGALDDDPNTFLVYEVKVNGVTTGTFDLTFLEDTLAGVAVTITTTSPTDDDPGTALIYSIKVNGVQTGTLNLTFLEDLVGSGSVDLTALNGRATALEGRANTVEGRATALEGRATTVEGRAGALETRTSSVESRTTGTESGISTLQGRATTSEAGLAAHGVRLTAAEAALSSIAADTTDVHSGVSGLANMLVKAGLETVATDGAGYATMNFPVAFPSQCVSCVVNAHNPVAPNNAIRVDSISASGIVIQMANNLGTPFNIRYIAIGS